MPGDEIPKECGYEAVVWSQKQSAQTHSSSGPPASESTECAGTGMKVAIQGEPGSFSHEAAMKLDPDRSIVPYSLSADVFAALSNGRCRRRGHSH